MGRQIGVRKRKRCTFVFCTSSEESGCHRTVFEVGIQAAIQKWLFGGCKEKQESIIDVLVEIYGFCLCRFHEKEKSFEEIHLER